MGMGEGTDRGPGGCGGGGRGWWRAGHRAPEGVRNVTLLPCLECLESKWWLMMMRMMPSMMNDCGPRGHGARVRTGGGAGVG